MTDWSPIRSVIIRVINKIGRPRSGSPISWASMVTDLIIYMKKLLDSDWLRAVQFKCNTGAKSV